MSYSESKETDESWTDKSYGTLDCAFRKAINYHSPEPEMSTGLARNDSNKDHPHDQSLGRPSTGKASVPTTATEMTKPPIAGISPKNQRITMQLSHKNPDGKLLTTGNYAKSGSEGSPVSFANFSRKWEEVLRILYWEKPKDSAKIFAEGLMLTYCVASTSLLKTMICFWFLLVAYYELVSMPISSEFEEYCEEANQRIFMDGISVALQLHRNVEFVSDAVELAWASLVNVALYGSAKTLAQFFFALCFCIYYGQFVALRWLAILGVVTAFTAPFIWRHYQTDIRVARQSLHSCLKSAGSLMANQVAHYTERTYRCIKKRLTSTQRLPAN